MTTVRHPCLCTGKGLEKGSGFAHFALPYELDLSPDSEPPADATLAGCMCVVVLRWKRVTEDGGGFLPASLATINPRLRRSNAGLVNRIERGVVALA